MDLTLSFTLSPNRSVAEGLALVFWQHSIFYLFTPGQVVFLLFAVAQWYVAWLETKGPQVRASPAALCCGL